MAKCSVAIAGGAIIVAVLASVPSVVSAVAPEEFVARTTQDLVDLCAATPDDPARVPAIHFCEGYIAGATAHHQVVRAALGRGPDFCPPQPPPTRDQAVALFVQWAKSNGQYMKEAAIDGLFRFLETTWPCRKP